MSLWIPHIRIIFTRSGDERTVILAAAGCACVNLTKRTLMTMAASKIFVALFLSCCFSLSGGFLLHPERRFMPHVESMRQRSSDDSLLKEATDVVLQRTYHVLSDSSDVVDPRRMFIEEIATYYTDVREMERTLILRDQQRQEILQVPVLETDKLYLKLGTLATILYLVCEEPSLLLKGRVLELDCEMGLAGLLSTMAMGALEHGDGPKFPSSVKALSLSNHPAEDSTPIVRETMEELFTGGRNSRVSVLDLDWTKHPKFQSIFPTNFKGILGCELMDSYASAKELARTVANFMDPNGRFMHMAPKDDPNVPHLVKFLTKGYAMSVDKRPVELQSHTYQPQPLDADGRPTRGLVLEKTKTREYECLLAAHHGDYDGYNGDYIWPMENGRYDGRDLERYMEPSLGPWYIR